MGRYTSTFCGVYSLETGMRVIAWFYIVIYLFNIFLNIFALDIVKSYKETVDEDLEFDKTSLLAFHYIFLAFGILTILLAMITLVKLSNQSTVFMEFIFQWNIFRCAVTLVGILYVCIAMNHIVTVAISCTVLVIDLCSSSYFTGIIASFVKSLDDPDALNTKERDNIKHTDVHLISHKRTSNLGQSRVTMEINGGIQNAGLDPETKQKVKSAAAVDGIAKEPTKVPQVEKTGEVSQPDEEKATDNDPKSTATIARTEHEKENTDSEKGDGDVGVVISENNSTITKEQEITEKHGDADINPTIETPQNTNPGVQDSDDTPNIGVNNTAFEVVELNQIRTEAVTVNVEGDDKVGDGKVMVTVKEVGKNSGAKSS